MYWYSPSPLIHLFLLVRLSQYYNFDHKSTRSIPVPFARTSVPFTWAPFAFTRASIPLARTSLSRRLTGHNRLICLAAIYIISHRMLRCLGWWTPLEVLLVLIGGKERLRRRHVRCFGSEHPKCKVVDKNAYRHNKHDEDLVGRSEPDSASQSCKIPEEED